MLLAIVGLFRTVPSSLAPTEDQGYVFVIGMLQDAASLDRTTKAVEHRRGGSAQSSGGRERRGVAGMDPLTFAFKTNAGIIWLPLKPWDERTGDENLSPGAVVSAVFGAGQQGEGCVLLRGRAAADRRPGHDRRLRGVHPVARPRHDRRIWKASRRSSWRRPRSARSSPDVRPTFSASVPQMRIDLDREKAMTLGVPVDRGVRYAAEHVRRAVRERLQSFRSRVPGAAAVRAALPRVSRGHPQRVCAREVGRARAADGDREHPRSDRSGNRRALQRVHGGEDHGQRRAGLQLRRCDRGDGRSRRGSAAARATRSRGPARRTRRRSAAARPTASICSAC